MLHRERLFVSIDLEGSRNTRKRDVACGMGIRELEDGSASDTGKNCAV